MAFPQGIDFRATAGYVTDPTNCDGEIGTTANYPRTSAQGNTVGWEDAPTGTRDRSAFTGDSAKVAGIHFYGGAGQIRYRIDLPSTGNYKFRVAAGDFNGGNDAGVDLYDTTTSLGSLVTAHGNVAANKYYDATDALRTSDTDWVTNNVLSADMNFTSTICRFKIGPKAASNVVIAHLWVEAGTASVSDVIPLSIKLNLFGINSYGLKV